MDAVLGEVDLDALTGDELSARICELDRERSRVELARVEAIATWDARQQWAADAATSAASWLAARCDLGRAEAGALVRTARRLRSMPLTAAAARAGNLGMAKVALLARAAGSSEAAAQAFARDEAVLVTECRRLTVDQVKALLRHWLWRVDAENTAKLAKAKHDRRRLHLSETFEGMWVLDGLLDPETGAELRRILAAEVEILRKADRALDPDLRRTLPQLRADALLTLVRGTTRVPATLSVIVPASDLRDRAGSGRTEDGTVLPPDTVRRHACDPVLRRVLTSEDGEVLDLGRRERLVSPAQRHALGLRDRGCVWSGCDQPPSRCEGHHIVHWADGGPTDMSNLVLLCDAHHHAVHERGFRLTKGPDGRLRFGRPDGTPIWAHAP